MTSNQGSAGRLDGKVTVITGAASGIGRATAERFAQEGARLVLADIDAERLDELRGELGTAVGAATRTDVTIEVDVEDVMAQTVRQFGRLDVAVNCAAGAAAPLTGLAADSWRRVIDVTLTGTFLSIKHEARRMVAQGTGGAIVNIVSISSRVPSEGAAAYCSAKAGLEMLVRCAAMELGQHGIRVTGIGPGLVHTPATAPAIEGSPELLTAFLHAIPLGRYGQASEIASAALFLASDEAAWISGDTLFVDGAELTREYPRRFELGLLPDNSFGLSGDVG